MYWPKRFLLLALALLVLGGLTARAIAPFAATALASVTENPLEWPLVVKAARPTWPASICPGQDCAARLTSPRNARAEQCGAVSAGISAGIVPCATNATVIVTPLSTGVSGGWAMGLAAALGGAGVVVLSAVVIIAARLR